MSYLSSVNLVQVTRTRKVMSRTQNNVLQLNSLRREEQVLEYRANRRKRTDPHRRKRWCKRLEISSFSFKIKFIVPWLSSKTTCLKKILCSWLESLNPFNPLYIETTNMINDYAWFFLWLNQWWSSKNAPEAVNYRLLFVFDIFKIVMLRS